MRVQRCVTPGAVALVIEICATAAFPNCASSTSPTAAAAMQCAQGYSGCIGVSTRGTHPVSATVASLPSRSPFRIAVIGRQKLYVYLASNTAMYASIAAMLVNANNLALSTSRDDLDIASDRTTGFQDAGPTIVQKRAVSV